MSRIGARIGGGSFLVRVILLFPDFEGIRQRVLHRDDRWRCALLGHREHTCVWLGLLILLRTRYSANFLALSDEKSVENL